MRASTSEIVGGHGPSAERPCILHAQVAVSATLYWLSIGWMVRAVAVCCLNSVVSSCSCFPGGAKDLMHPLPRTQAKLLHCRWRFSTLLRGFHQRAKRLHGNSECAARKAVDIGRVDADHFRIRIENRAAAAAVRRWGIVDEFMPDDIAKMAARRRR